MKTEIDALRAANGHRSASHAFASLYCWQREMGLSVLLREGVFAVRCLRRGENVWFFPCGERRAVRELVGALLEIGELRLCYLREEDKVFLEREFAGRFRFTAREDDAEYLYDRRAQAALAGKDFLAARKYIHRLEAGHEVTSEPLGEENLAEAAALVAGWRSRSEGTAGLADTDASATLLRCRRELDVTGVLVRVDGAPGAVMAGFPLGGGMFDLALGKQRCFLTGTAEYARRAFCAALPEMYTLVNGEEDLGIEGLRRVKRKMRPVGWMMMYEGRATAVDGRG